MESLTVNNIDRFYVFEKLNLPLILLNLQLEQNFSESVVIRNSVRFLCDKNLIENKLLLEKIKSIVEYDFNRQLKSDLVFLYTLLEATVKDYVIGLIEWHEKELHEIAEFKNFKLPLVLFNTLSKEERFEYLFEEHEKNVCVGGKFGVARFESILKSFKMNGSVRKEDEKNILELSQLRNCILHKNSIVDRKLLQNCQWLKYEKGEQIVISEADMHRFYDSVIGYNSLLHARHDKIYKSGDVVID